MLIQGNLIRSFNYTSRLLWDQVLYVLPNGNFACSGDSYVNIWNSKGNLLRTLNDHWSHPYHVTSMVVLKNGLLATGSSDATIIVYNYTSGEVKKTLSSSWYGVFSLAVLPNGNLVSTSPSGNEWPNFKKLTIWNVTSYTIVRTLEGHSGYSLVNIDVLKDGSLVSSSADGIKIWNTENGQLKNYFFKNKTVGFIKVLKNGNLAAVTENNTVTIVNSLNGAIIRILKGHKGQVRRLCELKNDYLATGSDDKTVKIWNLKTGSVVKTLNGHNYSVSSVATLSNGYLLSTSLDSKINIWS